MDRTRVWPLVLLTLWAAPALASFQAGTSKVEITPPVGGRMYGYGARGIAVSTGVHDPLYAKVLVMSHGSNEFALVTLDLGNFGAKNTRRVREKVRSAIGLDHVLLAVSHSHSAPTLDETFPTEDASWVFQMEDQVARAVVQAHQNRRPARIGVGWGRVEEGHNRRQVLPDGSVRMRWSNRERQPTSPVDYALGVVAVDTAGGTPLATLVHFTCHPVVLGPENLLISADYPGVMMATVEASMGGQAMFLQGAAGDINPFWDKTPPDEGAFEEMKKMGETLGREVLRARRSLSFTVPESLSVHRQFVDLEARWDLEDPQVQQAFRRRGGEALLRRYQERFKAESRAEINTVVVGGELAMATFPGEFFVEHGLRLKQSSPFENTLFVGYTNGALGYFPTLKGAAQGGYGGREATIVEAGAGEHLVERALVQLYYQAGKLHLVPSF